jgi:23S rRNA pseudouridine2605 synthase
VRGWTEPGERRKARTAAEPDAPARKPRAGTGAAREPAKPRAAAATGGAAPPTRARTKPASATSGEPAARKPARKSAGAERLAPAKVRLQKVLAAAGIAARRKAEDLIAAGRVTVNGKVADELGTKVDPDRDQIRVDGKFVQVEKKVYFVLNKPDGVVCSAEGDKDAEGRPTVLSLLPQVAQRVYPVGRLDFHTRGVLILTNDGDLAAALTHPRHEIPKTYHVKFQGRLDDAVLARLSAPVTLEDGTVTRPAEEVSVIKETDTNTWVQITLRQGLNRQVRRMGEALGHPVLKLIRVAVGRVTADGLDDGEFRPLTPTEVYDLMSAASGA